MVNSQNKEGILAVNGNDVSFDFGGRKCVSVLNGVNISVEKGVIYGLLGPSGCGKTTLLRCIVGCIKPKEGQIKVYGRCPGETDFFIPGRGVGYMPQELALYQEITMEETLTYFGCLYQMDRLCLAERISFLERFLDIPDKRRLIKELSGGQQRRVSFAVALIHKPPLLILDEPTVGVDPLLRKSIWNHLISLAAEDCITIIITTHYVEEARQANVVGLMRNGHLLAESNPEVLVQKHHLPSLEDVFLKLCQNDVEDTEVRSAEEASVTVISEVNNPAHEETSDPIWLNQKVGERKRTGHLQKEDTEENIYNDSSISQDITSALLIQENVGTTERETKPSCQLKMKESWNRFTTLINKNFIRLKRNIPLLFFQLLTPSLQVIVFCICVGGEPYDLPVAVTNMENTPTGFSNKFLQTINNRTINQKIYSNISLALESVHKGETWGAVYIGPQFTSYLIQRFIKGGDIDNKTIDGSSIKLYLDMTNQQIGSTVYTTFLKDFQIFAQSILVTFNKNPLLVSSPIVLETPVYGKKDPNLTEFMAPGMILSITYIMAVGLTSMCIIFEKKQGLLDRTWVAGVSPVELLLSLVFSIFILMAGQVGLVLAFTFLAFDLPSEGPFVWVVICVLLVGFCGMAYGFLISTVCDDENSAIMVAMGSFYPNLLLSGIIWPVEAMPQYLRYFSYCLPMTLISNSFRFILSRGWTISDNYVWQGFLITLAWVVLLLGLSIVIFKVKK